MSKILVLKLDDEYVDSQGDILPTNAKIEFDSQVNLVHDFKSDEASLLGTAQLFREGDEFYIKNVDFVRNRFDRDVNKLVKHLESALKEDDVYPAVGGMVRKREDGKVLDFSINMVSFSMTPNTDTRIQSVKKQLEAQDAN
jgi:hypothetical protein